MLDYKKDMCFKIKKNHEDVELVIMGEKEKQYLCVEVGKHYSIITMYSKTQLDCCFEEIQNNFVYVSNLYNVMSSFTKLSEVVHFLGIAVERYHSNFGSDYHFFVAWFKYDDENGTKYLQLSYSNEHNLCHVVVTNSFWNLNLNNHEQYYVVDEIIPFMDKEDGIYFKNYNAISAKWKTLPDKDDIPYDKFIDSFKNLK